jgi:hypothetical protein
MKIASEKFETAPVLLRGKMGLGATWFWPDVSSRKDVLFAIDEAFWVAVIVGVFTAAFSAIESGRSGQLEVGGFASAALFVGIAFGV